MEYNEVVNINQRKIVGGITLFSIKDNYIISNFFNQYISW